MLYAGTSPQNISPLRPLPSCAASCKAADHNGPAELAGTLPSQYLIAIVIVRLTRFPKSLARSEFKSLDKSFFGKTGIQPEDHIPQQKIAEGIQSVFVFQIQWFYDIAETLGHFALVGIPVAMDIQMPVWFNARAP